MILFFSLDFCDLPWGFSYFPLLEIGNCARWAIGLIVYFSFNIPVSNSNKRNCLSVQHLKDLVLSFYVSNASLLSVTYIQFRLVCFILLFCSYILKSDTYVYRSTSLLNDLIVRTEVLIHLQLSWVVLITTEYTKMLRNVTLSTL